MKKMSIMHAIEQNFEKFIEEKQNKNSFIEDPALQKPS